MRQDYEELVPDHSGGQGVYCEKNWPSLESRTNHLVALISQSTGLSVRYVLSSFSCIVLDFYNRNEIAEYEPQLSKFHVSISTYNK